MKMHLPVVTALPLTMTTISTPGVSIFAKDKVEKKREGVESRFVIPSHFDGEMSLRYIKKEKSSSTPLIYAYLESEVNGIIFSDTELRTKIFNIQSK